MSVTFLAAEPDAAAEPTPVVDHLPDFVLVPTAEIELGERLREIDPVWASALGQVMKREGQRTPIEVCRLPGKSIYTVVSGGHRFVGAREAGIVYLRAEIVSADRTDRRLREISENLWRRDLQPIDRAAFIAELVTVRRLMAGLEAVAHRDASVKLPLRKRIDAEAGETLETISNVYGFTEEVGAELGLTGRTIRNDLMLYRGIAPSQIERLRVARHPSMGNATQLRALAKLDPVSQNKVVDLLVWPGASLNYGQPSTIADAIKHPLGPKPAKAKSTAGDKHLTAFLGAFQRMGLPEKKAALSALHAQLPKGFRIVEGEQSPPVARFPAEHERYREEALAAIDTMRELVDGVIEDELLPGERESDLRRASGDLQMARFTICANGFELGGAA